jgi:hypothetical protein
MIGLKIVLDEWARPEPPADEVPVVLTQGEYVVSARRGWQLDMMLAARIARPGSLLIVTGI